LAYFLGNLVDTDKVRVSLIYSKEPSQAVKDNYDEWVQGTRPDAINYRGKSAVLYFTPSTSELFYEYVDKAMTENDLTQQDISWLAQVSTKSQVLEGSLTDAELVKLGKLYPDWETGIDYAIDDVISYHNELYQVIQAHTSQESWTPDVATSLFTKVAPAGVIAEWVQPTGSHDAYDTGDQVTWNGNTWESDIDANVWEPGVYGWTEL